MSVTAAQRKIWLGTALVLTLAATVYFWIDDGQTADDVDLVVATAAPHRSQQPRTRLDIANAQVSPLPARTLQEASRDIFALPPKEPEPEQKKPPLPPPPPPAQVHLPVPQTLPMAPPPPSAPPLPFTYIGKLGEEGKYTVFLSVHGKNYAVKTGEVVAQLYRVEEIKPPMLTMTYIPMKIKQTMQIGEAN